MTDVALADMMATIARQQINAIVSAYFDLLLPEPNIGRAQRTLREALEAAQREMDAYIKEAANV